ncbi:MAG: VOC family protein [Chlorobia bacterium]|nr:VOC family protein [Fimbriimonadaceae bacterium]
MKMIVPNLWFDTQAEEAARYYVSIFKNSKVKEITHYGESAAEVSKVPKGTVLTVNFELNGQRFTGINGGPMFKFNEAVSFLIECEDQAEVDYYWDKLLEGGEPQACGWLKDKYGLSWQVVPIALETMMLDPDKAKAERMMAAMLKMVKLDLAELEEAFNG